MIRRIGRLYPVSVKIVRGRGQFAPMSHQQLLKSAIKQANILEDGTAGEMAAMKTFTVAAVVLALIAVPVHAQGKRQPAAAAEQKKPDDPAKKAAENAYKAALERIPEPKEKYDPWGVARPAEPAKNPK
jgi:hypothetical protein